MKELFAALSKAQAEFKPVKKDSKGYNYKYADINAILEIVRPALSKHGLSIIQMPTMDEGRNVLRTLISHESGDKISFCTPIFKETAKNMNEAQSYGSAISYTRRYALVSCLSLEMEDDDGKGAGQIKNKYTSNTNQKTTSANLISEPQRKRLFALAKNLNENEIKTILKKHGLESSKEITKNNYEKICIEIEDASELKKAGLK